MSQLLSTSELIKKYQLDAKKSLGQNFILDKNFTDKIAKSAGDLSDFEVLEIGIQADIPLLHLGQLGLHRI